MHRWPEGMVVPLTLPQGDSGENDGNGVSAGHGTFVSPGRGVAHL